MAIVFMALGVLNRPPQACAGTVTLDVNTALRFSVPEVGQLIPFMFTLTNGTANDITLSGYANTAAVFVGGHDTSDKIDVSAATPTLPIPFNPPNPNPNIIASGKTFTFERDGQVSPFHGTEDNPDFGIWEFSTQVVYQAGANPGATNTITIDVTVEDVPTPELSPGPMAGALMLLIGGVLTLTGGRLGRNSAGDYRLGDRSSLRTTDAD
jgi:hypothetical protein